ncbi:MAG: MFS transporter [Pirellulales bacterium]
MDDERKELPPGELPATVDELDDRRPSERPVLDASGPTTHVRFGVLALLCTAALIAYIQRNSIGAMEKVIEVELGLDKKQMGLVMSSFFLSYAVFQLPTGWLAHVFGTRRALPIFATAWSAATGCMGFCTGLWSLCVTRFATGAVQAGIFPCSTNTISKWFPASARGFPNGALASFMSVGGATGMALAGIMLGWGVSWQMIYVLFATFGLVWAVGFYWWFRDYPSQHRRVNQAERTLIGHVLGEEESQIEEGPVEPTPWRAIFSSVAMWWICGQHFFRAAGYIFFATWFPRYLQETHLISVKESALYTTLPLIAAVLGSLAGGTVMDWIYAKTGSLRASRQLLAVGCMLACAGLVFVAYFVEAVTPAVMIISSASFCATVGGPAAYTITIDMGGRHVATVFSTMNMSGSIGAVVFPAVVPWIESWLGWGAVLLTFGGLYVGAAVCWLMLRTDGTVFDHSLIRNR